MQTVELRRMGIRFHVRSEESYEALVERERRILDIRERDAEAHNAARDSWHNRKPTHWRRRPVTIRRNHP